MNAHTKQPRLHTSIPGLEQLLDGGFPQGGVYLIMGPPGSGKTVLGNQICFEQSQQNNQTIFVTLLSENHAQMLQHMQGFSFYDQAVIGQSIHYFSGYTALDKEGLPGLLALLRRIMRDYEPTVLVIDGLSTTTMVDSELELKRFINKLQAHAALQKCTVFLLTHLHVGDAMQTEHTIVDGIIRLHHHVANLRPVGEIQIQKMRGIAHLHGYHFYNITPQGIKIYPRLEALVPPAIHQQPATTERLQTGIVELDRMLHGGVHEGSMTLLIGPPGSGKTILGLQFLSTGLQHNQPGLYVGFSETPAAIKAKAHNLSISIEATTTQQSLHMIGNTHIERMLDDIGQQILFMVKTQQIKRLFIDGLEGLHMAAIVRERLPAFTQALANHLQVHGVTTFVSIETEKLLDTKLTIPTYSISALGFSENIILLRHIEHQATLQRIISIMKMRQSDFDQRIHSFRITNAGIEVDPNSTTIQ